MGYNNFTGKIIAIDTETTGLIPWKGDEAFAVGMCNELGETWYKEWEIDPVTRIVYPNEEDCQLIESLMCNPDIVKVMHNSKFDLRMLDLHLQIQPKGVVHDTMYAARICNTAEPTVSLKPLARKYVGIPDNDEKDLQQAVVAARRAARKITFTDGSKIKLSSTTDAESNGDYWLPRYLDPTNRLCEIYCRRDVERTMLLWFYYEQMMDQNHLRVRHTYDAEIELRGIVYDMETRGVAINRDRTIRERLQKLGRMEELQEQMERIAGKAFNPRSSRDLQSIIYGSLALPCLRKTEGGDDSTNWKAITPHRGHPFVDALFTYRACSKAVEAFDKYLELMVPDIYLPLGKQNPDGHAIHANFRQDGTVTGRFSCKEPNLQNVAKNENQRTNEPMRVRAPFGPRPGYVWYAFDYSQMELVAFADCANEPLILNAYAEDKDLHAELADKAWGGIDNPLAVTTLVSSLGVDRAEAETLLLASNYSIVAAEKSKGVKTARSRAKTIMYAKLYGGGPGSVVDFLGCSFEQAARFMKDYDRAFPSINRYIRELEGVVRDFGYIVNRYGRRLAVPEQFAYKAVNYMIQGSCADLVKRSMLRVAQFFKENTLDAHIVAQIHDEIIYEVAETPNYKEANLPMLKEIKRIMEDNEGAFKVTIKTDCSRIVSSWDEKETVKL